MPDLSDMMDPLDSIDLEKFSLTAVGEPPKPPPETPPQPPEAGGMSPDMKALLETVQKMQQDFEGIKQRMEQPTPPQPPPGQPPKPPEPPTDEEIEAAFAAGDNMKAVRLAQQQYAMRNFVPAMMRMAHQVEEYKKQGAVVDNQSVQHMAARAVQDYVHSDPRLTTIAGDIYDAFRDMPSNYILQEGVIENVVSQVIGKKAREGTWSSHIPATAPTGQGGPSPGNASPLMLEMFRNLTGVENVDASVVEALMHPRAINIGRGEG